LVANVNIYTTSQQKSTNIQVDTRNVASFFLYQKIIHIKP